MARSFLSLPCHLHSAGSFGLCWLMLLVFAPIDALCVQSNPPSPIHTGCKLGNYSSYIWETENGLPHNDVRAICRTRDGYLWVGTREGLARFDGARFTCFNSANTPGFPNAYVTVLHEGRDGNLWVGTEEGFGRFKNGRFDLFRLQGAAANRIRSIFESSDHVLWVGTMNGLFRYRDGASSRFTTKHGLASDVIPAIWQDAAGVLWVAADAGLSTLQGETFIQHRSAKKILIRSTLIDSKTNFWLGTWSGLALKEGDSYRVFAEHQGLPGNMVNAICEDQSGNLWVGTSAGLCRFLEGQFFVETQRNGEAYDTINCIIEDCEGNIWVGAKDGLHRLKSQPFTTFTKQQGLSCNNIMSVLEDTKGNLWVGGWGGGLDRIIGDTIASYNPSGQIMGGYVLSLHECRDGSVWVGMDYNHGVYQVRDDQVTRYTAKEGLKDPAVAVIYEDSARNIWLGTRNGLYRVINGEFNRYTTKDGLAGNSIRVILEDSKGRIWVGTTTGLSSLKEGVFTTLKTPAGESLGHVVSMFEDTNRTLWIGTRGSGLYQYHNENLQHVTTTQGLFDNNVLEILDDCDGRFWMSSMKGVFRVNKRDLENLCSGAIDRVSCVSYGKEDGLLGTMCNGVARPSGWRAKDGRLWFATTKGVAMTDPKTISDKTNLPLFVVIQELEFDQQPVDLGNSIITLSPGRGEIEFRFAALHYSAPEKVRYKYKLEGVDENWVDAGSRRSAHYNNIFPGTYVFRVTACNGEGVWDSKGATATITLQPHFWQTWWFPSILGLLTVGMVAGVVRFITHKKMQRKLERLEQQNALERERARIARDMHDDLGSSLTRITLLGELIEADKANSAEVEKHARKVISSARETVKSLDEIVWAVDPENDTLNGLVDYISHYTDEFFENSEVRCRLEMPADLPHSPLPSEFRHNVFLILKEALNNVLRHASASEVHIGVCVNKTTLRVTISDNGRGFDIAQTQNVSDGNGLGNMRERAEAIGGRLQMQSVLGHGTNVQIEIDLEQIRE